MPDTALPVLDEDTGPEAAQSGVDPLDTATASLAFDQSGIAPPVENTPEPQGDLAPAKLAPPHWNDIASNQAFQSLSPDMQKQAFTKWVADSSDYLTQSNVPRKNLGTFQDYVSKTGQQYGLGFVFGEDGKPVTNAQQAAINGGTYPTGFNFHGRNLSDVPFTVPYAPPSDSVSATVGRGLDALAQGTIGTPLKAVEDIYSGFLHHAIDNGWINPASAAAMNDLPALDKSLAINDEAQKENAAATGSTLEQRLGEGAGNLVSTTFGGRSLKAIGTIAALEGADSTYHNAIEQGANKQQAIASAGISIPITAATFAVLGGTSSLALKSILGDNAAQFLAGGYKPTVQQAATLMGLDAASLGASGYSGQVAQNEADKLLYDPSRDLTQGALQNAGGMALFSLIHAPGLLKAFYDNRSALQSAKTEVSNAQGKLALATQGGKDFEITAAQDEFQKAQDNLNGIISQTAKDAHPPTPDDIQQAKDIQSGQSSPAVNSAPIGGIDDVIAKQDAEAANPELPTVADTESANTPVTPEEVTPAPVETPAPVISPVVPDSTAQGVGPMTVKTVKENPDVQTQAEPEAVQSPAAPVDAVPEAVPSVEQSVSAEQGSSETPESAAPLAEPSPTIKAYLASGLRRLGVKGITIAYGKLGDTPAWADPKNPGKVFINPEVLAKVLSDAKSFPNERARRNYVQRLVSEEVAHDAQHSVEAKWVKDGTHTDNIERIYNEITPEERAKTIQTYGADHVDPSKAESPEDEFARKTQLVREHVRQLIQKRLEGETTEDSWLKAHKPALVRYLQAIYQQLKSRISRVGDNSELGKYLTAIEGVLDDARRSGHDVDSLDVSKAAIPPRDDIKEGFYSQLSRVIDSKMPGRASADQIRSMLKGNGVKDDEIKWSGLDDYLKANPQATKADVQKFLAEEGKVNLKTVQDTPRYKEYRTAKGKNYREQVLTYPEKGEGNYVSPHFPDVENYLAHTRLSDSTDAEGKSGTVIEEAQSDRGQRLRDDQNIPSMPFQKSWPELLFRKSLQQAVESGKDWIGWVTGDEHAAKAPEALRKVVDNISWKEGSEPGTRTVTATKDGKTVFEGTMDTSGHLTSSSREEVQDRHLSEVIGKAMADRVTSETSGSIDGKDFTVGAAGLKAFYDKIVPNYVKQYAKKWGVKPELSKTSDGTPIWKLPINDAMRESIQREGQPTFAPKPPSDPEEMDKTVSKAATPKWDQAKTILQKINHLVKESYKLKNFDDWAKFTGRYGTMLAEGINRSNAVFRDLKVRLPDKTVSGGVIRYIEAGGDMAKLKQWRDDTYKNKDTRHLTPYYEAAMNLTADQKATAGKISQLLESTRQLAKTWGMDIAKRDNYFPRTVDEGDGSPASYSGNSLNTGFKNKLQRTHESLFDGEQAGVKYKTQDAATGTAAYLNNLNRAIAARKFVASMFKGVEDDGRPMLAPAKSSWSEVSNPPKGVVHLVTDKGPNDATSDYKHLDIPALRNWSYAGEVNGTPVMHQTDLWVNPRTATKIENVFGTREGPSNWWKQPSVSGAEATSKRATKLLLNDINGIAKANLFALSPFFHPIQIGAEALAHGNNPMALKAIKDALKFIPSKTIRSWEGIKPPDFSDPKVADASDRGLVLHPEEFLPDAEGASDTDKTFLRWAEIAAQKLGKKPGEIATYLKNANQEAQNWIFQKYIPALKMQNYSTALEANKKRFASELASGEYTLDDVKYQTAKTINYAYGHLNYAQMARNPNVQTALRTILLAPDFFEARGKHLGQSLLGAVGSKAGRENFVAMARMALGLGISAQVANYMINGETYGKDHPFEVKIGNRFYGVRTAVGDAVNLFKDSYNIATNQGKGLPYLNNRLSPMSRFITEAVTGLNWRGEKTPFAGAITDLIAGSTPMIAQGALSQVPGLDKIFVSTHNNTISPLESAMGALGLKISRYSPIMQMKTQAHDWIAKGNGIPLGLKPDNTTYPVSQYRPLQFALDDGDYGAAWDEYQKLLKDPTNNPQKIARGMQASFNAPYTGSSKGDRAFYQSLDDHDKALFDAAKQRQNVLMQRFREVLYSEHGKQ